MSEHDLGASSRDILIEVRGLVKQLVESRDDHETRIRSNERDVAAIQTQRQSQEDSTKRLIMWGMFLAAMAGAFGNGIMKAISGH